MAKNEDSQENIKDEDTEFWSKCPVCGEDAVISGLCTECGAYIE